MEVHMTEPVVTAGPELSWLLDEWVDQTVGVKHALVVAADGIRLARSAGLKEDVADRLAASSSSIQSVGKGVSSEFEFGGVAQNLVQMELGFFLVSQAGAGALLAVIAQTDHTMLNDVLYAMDGLVAKVGRHLTAAPRDQRPEAERT
jgi:predicted regulator of Ras-like GTPase activity (Roadblock/LC7/MglB family)